MPSHQKAECERSGKKRGGGFQSRAPPEDHQEGVHCGHFRPVEDRSELDLTKQNQRHGLRTGDKLGGLQP